MTESPQPATETLDVLKIRDVRPERWRKALAAIEAIAPNVSVPQHRFASIQEVETYFAGQPDQRMVEALQVIHDLGSRRGRDAILQARRARNLTPVHAADVQGESEEALDLWMASLTDPAEADVLAIATVIASRQNQQQFFEYRGRSALALSSCSLPKAKLEQALLDLFEAHGMTGGVQVTCTEWNGEVVLRVLHGEREIVVHEKVARGTRRQPLVLAAYDIIRYSPATGMLAIRARTTLIDPYRQIVGLTVFGDVDFFSDDDLLDLTHLRRADSLQRAQDLDGILRVRVTQIAYRTNLGRTTLAAADCHALAEREGSAGTLAGSRIAAATLSFVFEGSGRTRCTVRLALPNVIKPSDPRRREQVRAVLRRLKVLRERGPEAPLGELLAGGYAPLQQWKDRYGAATIEACVRSGVLAPPPDGDRLLLVDASQDGAVIPISGLSNGAIGISFIEDSVRVPRLIHGESDLGYALNGLQVAKALAEAFGMPGSPKDIPALGVIEVGRRGYGTGQLIHCFLALTEVSNESVAALRQLTSPAFLVVITPREVRWPALDGCASVAIDLPALDLSDLPYRAVSTLRLTEHICPSEWAPDSRPLVLHRAKKQTWWRRAPVTVREDDFARLLKLAEADGGVIHHADIEKNAGSPAKRLIDNLKKQLPKSLRGFLKSSRSTGYHLAQRALIL